MVETNKANFWRKWKGSGSAVIPVYQDDLRDAICDNNLLAVQEIIQENPDCLKVSSTRTHLSKTGPFAILVPRNLIV